MNMPRNQVDPLGVPVAEPYRAEVADNQGLAMIRIVGPNGYQEWFTHGNAETLIARVRTLNARASGTLIDTQKP